MKVNKGRLLPGTVPEESAFNSPLFFAAVSGTEGFPPMGKGSGE